MIKNRLLLKSWLERGKQTGHLSTQEIDTLIVELDLDVDELGKAQ